VSSLPTNHDSPTDSRKNDLDPAEVDQGIISLTQLNAPIAEDRAHTRKQPRMRPRDSRRHKIVFSRIQLAGHRPPIAHLIGRRRDVMNSSFFESRCQAD
jgi:hypothetical protein